jgi:hypothetical protein
MGVTAKLGVNKFVTFRELGDVSNRADFGVDRLMIDFSSSPGDRQ